jgi:hypothetical protein
MNDSYVTDQEAEKYMKSRIDLSVWAIRQKSTRFFLPARKGGRGYSFDEPTKDCFPRLFKSELSASRALSAWLRGTWDQPVYDHDEWSHTDYKVAAEPTKVEGRDPADMEIVEFVIFERLKGEYDNE